MIRALGSLVEEEEERGAVYVDSTRLSVPGVDLSVEPDVVCVLVASIEAGRVRLVPRASGEEGRFVEVEGPADLVVECVSDSSRSRDAVRLRDRYERAGVREYWLVDAREQPPSLAILAMTDDGYAAVSPDDEGVRRSPLLDRDVRLARLPLGAGLVRHRLDLRPWSGRRG